MRFSWKACRLLLKVFSIFPIKNNKIVFSSYHAEMYACNPMCISQELQKNKDLEIIWILPKGVIVPNGIKVAHKRTLAFFFHYATAKVWIDNTRKPVWMIKRKGQYYIQTWHAGITFKKVEADASDKLPQVYIDGAKNDSCLADGIISGCKWCSNLYKKSFWFSGKVLEFGQPRSDVFYENYETTKEKVRIFYGLNKSDNIVVYAPTFRDNASLKKYDIDYLGVICSLKKRFGGTWKVIVRLHPNIQDKQNSLSYNDIILNGSLYPEMNDLIVFSDVLISDYSSCVFDAMECKKIVFLFALDVDEYIAERGLYFNPHNLPSPLAETNGELIANIELFNMEKYYKEVEQFNYSLGIFNDGKASVRTAEHVLSVMKNEL